MWVPAYGHAQRVDPSMMTVTATIRIPGLQDQNGIAIGAAVWVTVEARHEVVEIDPATAQIIRRVGVPNHPLQVVADGSIAWVISATSGAGRVYQIDGATGAVMSRGSMSTSPRLPFTTGGGAAWVADEGKLRRFGTRDRGPCSSSRAPRGRMPTSSPTTTSSDGSC